MASTVREPIRGLHRNPWGLLPSRIKVLYIGTRQRTGRWLADALAADSATQVILEEAYGESEGAIRLRDEAFDAVLINHAPGQLDALDLLEGLRAGGTEEPIILLGELSESEMATLAYEGGADGYLCVSTATTRTLIWLLARALERHDLLRENRRLATAERHRLQMEQQETERLLAQQHALIDELEELRWGVRGAELETKFASTSEEMVAARPPRCSFSLPDRLVDHYRELLQAYVIMGSGNLCGEMSQLGELLASVGITADQCMQLHLRVLEELVRGLGSRSTRHVMMRADLMVLEVMVHLAECYRTRYREATEPPRQRLLPGFVE